MRHVLSFLRRLSIRQQLAAATLLAMVAAALSATTLGAFSGNATAGVSDEAIANVDEQALLPTSHSELAGGLLTVHVPASSLTVPATGASTPPTPGTDATDDAIGEISWEAALQAAQAGQRDPDLTAYALIVDGLNMTPDETSLSQSALRSASGQDEYGRDGLRRVGTVPLATLMDQANSNLSVLRSVLSPDEWGTAKVIAKPQDATAGEYAVEFDLTVRSLADLQPHLGDLVVGLRTGLFGDDSDPVNGVAINVADADGHSSGWWSASSIGTGWSTTDPTLPRQDSMGVTTDFPVLTGGPHKTGAVSGGFFH